MPPKKKKAQAITKTPVTPVTAVVPAGNPSIRRRFQWTELDENKNRAWLVEWWPDGTMITTWGRTQVTEQKKTKTGVSRAAVEKLIASKLRKGYKEVDLLIPVITTVPALPAPDGSTTPAQQTVKPISSSIKLLLDLVFAEAGESISKTLAVAINELSQRQISKGLSLLLDIQTATRNNPRAVTDLVKQYYNTIPTKLPHKIKSDDVVKGFVRDMAEIEDYLHSLEAALATHQHMEVDHTLSGSYNSLGCILADLPESHENYAQIVDYVKQTIGPHSSRRIKHIYRIKVPGERARYESSTVGKENVVHLFHGTHNKNLRHIFRTGLIVPKVYSHGRRFGNGVYFADEAAKSINYTAAVRYGAPTTLFMADVAIGNPKKMSGVDERLNAAPNGYHSVWGTHSHGGMDEFIVYSLEQQTLRAVVLLD